MAVIEDVPGVKVKIHIGDVDCTEYDDPDAPVNQAAQPTSSKYIESHDDTEFGINIAVDENYQWGYKNHVLSFQAYIDSMSLRGLMVQKKDLSVDGRYASTIKDTNEFRRETGSWLSRNLKFSAVKTIDNASKERIKKDIEVARDLGVIQVKVYRKTNHGILHGYKPHYLGKGSACEFAEKSLKGKAISHGATFSAAKTIQSPQYYDCRDLPEDNGPIAIFQFHYRSKQALQQELIIPTTVSTRSATFDGLSEAERDRLAMERLEQINEEKRIKKENMPVIKREFDEVFDLTEDDDNSGRHTKIPRISEAIDLTNE